MIADEKAQGGKEEQSSDGGITPAAARRPRGSKGSDPHVSSALRTAYQATVQEDVPPEFLDLLGKLA